MKLGKTINKLCTFFFFQITSIYIEYILYKYIYNIYISANISLYTNRKKKNMTRVCPS